MNNLEKQLRGLKKVEPSARFLKESKSRLLFQVSMEHRHSWMKQFIKKVSPVSPDPRFVVFARERLVSRIEAAARPVVSWAIFMKRLAASTLVMALAVTSTLFFVDGNQLVAASESTFLEVMAGEVSVKHADKIIWDVVTEQVALSPGDLVRLGEEGRATIHFADDSQLRLAENSTLLLSRMGVSSGYARQGINEVSLHQGKAWVQTLNVDDGFANFTLITRDAIIDTLNASFAVETNPFESTTVQVFRNGVDVSVLREDTRDVFASGKLNTFQQVTLDAVSATQKGTELASLTTILDIADEDRSTEWVERNLDKDRFHLADLRGRELDRLQVATGSLPGHVFYPLKRAKERLRLAIGSDQEETIKMANRRLNEALVLIEEGQSERARAALLEYQELVLKVAKAAESKDELSNQVVKTHQKTLVAALPSDREIGIVRKVLSQTEELLAENPAEKVEIRLDTSLSNIAQIQSLVAEGDLVAAEELLASHTIDVDKMLVRAEGLDGETKIALYEQILATQHEQKRLLAEISNQLSESEAEGLAQLVNTTAHQLSEDIKHTAAVVQPVLPDIVLDPVVVLPVDEKVHEFVQKVNIYSSDRGQQNQINRLLKAQPELARDLEFLEKARVQLDTRSADLISVRIIELRRDLAAAKSRRMQLKIDRAIKEREKRSSEKL